MKKFKQLKLINLLKRMEAFFADSLLKLEEMGSYPLLSISLYMAIEDISISQVSSL